MRKMTIIFFILILSYPSFSQFRISVLNPEADSILHGSYNPILYTPSELINSSDDILNGFINEISADSLQSYLEHLDLFYNRNTASDTLSDVKGIGAARRWILSKFQEFSEVNEGRLIPSFMRFKSLVCGVLWHKNVFAVLPGLDTTLKEIIIIEGHFDTRCEGACDTTCYTPGMDDNGSGTVLVMELARIMSKYAFDRTIVFLATTGEDQGLHGASAFAMYVEQENIPVMAVLNNDVVGGIICGHTSSPPGCPFEDHIDSTNVRVFSYSHANDSGAISPHKQLARYIKMQQEEKINPLIPTSLNVNIMIQEDRVGRSGDHMPFSDRGYPAIRYCSANEHGDGSGTAPDHQHTTMDVLGLDLSEPLDGIIDTFFVDMNYLKRNTISNGVNAAFLALSPKVPNAELTGSGNGMVFNISSEDSVYNHYRVGVRKEGSGSLYFDTIYNFHDTHNIVINDLEGGYRYFLTLMNVENGIESSFPDEAAIESTLGIFESEILNGVMLGQNYPNPSSGNTEVIIKIDDLKYLFSDNRILIKDISGRVVQDIPIDITSYKNNIKLEISKSLHGMYLYSLVMDGVVVKTMKMILL